MVGVGIIGAGFAANLHVEAIKKVYGVDVKLAAVAATTLDRAVRFAEQHGMRQAYGSYRELLRDPGVDVVCVCVPNGVHASVIKDAVAAGKHVICEKPLTGAFGVSGLAGVERARDEHRRAMESVSELEQEIARAGVLFMYAENWIYAPAMAKTKRLLAESRGKIVDIRAEESHSGSHAKRSRRRETAGGGSLIMLGSHPVAAAIHLKNHEGVVAGRAPVRVESVTAEVAALHESVVGTDAASHRWLVSDWDDVETWANVVLGFDDGTKAVVTASFAMLGGVRNKFEVYTTNAAFRIDMTPNDGLMAFTPDPEAFGDEYLHEKVESRAGWNAASPDEDWVRGYPQEMQDFMECVASRRHPISDFTLAKDVVDITYLSYISAAEGRRIGVPRS